MKSTTSDYASWEDLLFEKRNKSYGAYELRTGYHARLVRSLVYALLSLALVFFSPVLLKKIFPEAELKLQHVYNDPIVFSAPFVLEQLKPAVTEHPAVPKIKAQSLPKDPLNFKPVTGPVEKAPGRIETALLPVGPVSSAISTEPAGTGTSGGTATDVLPSSSSSSGTYSQSAVDIMPEFPGGLDKFYEYIVKKLHFTALAQDAGLDGKYFVSFIVNETGLISEVKLLRSIGYGMDEVVISVLNASPKWIPGKFQAHSVKTSMILPIKFSLIK